MAAGSTGRGLSRVDLDPHPAATLAFRISGGRGETVPWMKVPGNEPRSPKKLRRRPSVAVEDPDPVPDDTAGRMDLDLPGKVRNNPHVVVAEDELRREPPFEQLGEEIEDHRSQRSRRPNDGVLRIPRDHDRVGPCLPSDAYQFPGEGRARTLDRAVRSDRTRSEAEVDIGYHQRPRPSPAGGFDQ